MLVPLGMLVVLAGVLGGYAMQHGSMRVLLQPSEILIVGAASLGSLLVMASPTVLGKLARAVRSLLTGEAPAVAASLDRLVTVYRVLRLMRLRGRLVVEEHIEEPRQSDVFAENPEFLDDAPALEFFCDAMKVVVLGTVAPDHVAEMTELSLRTHEDEEREPIHVLLRVADALPGLGMVAAVLGIVVTMQGIEGNTSQVGQSVAAALIGTLLGVLLCYGFVGPLAARLEARRCAGHDRLKSLQACVAAFAQGVPPHMCVEFGRRALASSHRPGFDALERACHEASRQLLAMPLAQTAAPLPSPQPVASAAAAEPAPSPAPPRPAETAA